MSDDNADSSPRKDRAKRALRLATQYLGVAHVEMDEVSLRDALTRSVGEYLSATNVTLSDELMFDLVEEAQSALGRAVLAFGWRHYRTPRSRIGKRLSQFKVSLEQLVRALGTVDEVLESSGPMRDKIDLEVLRFVATFGSGRQQGAKAEFEKYWAARLLIEPMFIDAKAALAAFDDLPNGGRPELGEYDHVVEAALYIADRLGIKTTIAGDRAGEDADSPYSTTFTRLVFFGLEPFLPEDILKARSQTLAACAKRIERSVLWREHRGLG